MSYVQARRRRMKRRKPQGHRAFVAVGDDWQNPAWTTNFTDLFNHDDYSACSDTADQQTAPIDAAAADIGKNWNVADNVAPDDLRKIVDQVMTMQKSGRTALEKAMAEAPETQHDLLFQMLANMNDIGLQAGNYYTAANAAKAAGTPVSAPGLKRWVEQSILKVSSATHASSVVLCQIPWWVSALGAITAAVQGVVAVCKAIVGIALVLGEKAVAAVEEGLDAIAMLEKIAPFAIVGLAAWWLFLREKRRKAA